MDAGAQEENTASLSHVFGDDGNRVGVSECWHAEHRVVNSANQADVIWRFSPAARDMVHSATLGEQGGMRSRSRVRRA